MAAAFAINSDAQENALVLSLRGELDIASSPSLERALSNAQATSTHRIVIDLTGLEFMDSSGLHTFIRAQQRAQAKHQQLVLITEPRQVQLVFEMSGTAGNFAFEETVSGRIG